MVSHGVPGEAAGLRTPAASHRPLPTLGYFRWVTFKLFVPYSFIIRSLFVIIRSLCKQSHARAMLVFLGAILGSLRSILGSLEAILGAPGGLGKVLGRSMVVLGGLGALLERHEDSLISRSMLISIQDGLRGRPGGS